MKTYNTIAEVEKDIVDGVLTVQGDVHFTMTYLKIDASIVIKAGNIKAGNIQARNIKARDIEAGDIEAGNIEAGDIEAVNIEAFDIKAGNISFYGVCWSYFSFRCKSVVGRRKKSKYFCLDSEVEIISEPEVTEMTVAEISKALGKQVKIVE